MSHDQEPAPEQHDPKGRRYMLHACIDIEGFLESHREESMTGIFSDPMGRPLGDREARQALYDELRKGRRVIPVAGKGVCVGFDYDKGCPGHPIDDEQPEQPEAT